jgi:hypothetical protein
VSRVNEPAPTGPYLNRIRPVEAYQKEAGGDPHGPSGDSVLIRGGQGHATAPVVHPAPGSSRAYLVIVGFVAVLIAAGAWWGGQPVLLGIGLGWLTALLLFLVRKDLVSEFHELFW